MAHNLYQYDKYIVCDIMDSILKYMKDEILIESVRSPASECHTSLDYLPVMRLDIPADQSCIREQVTEGKIFDEMVTLRDINKMLEPNISSLQLEEEKSSDEVCSLLSECLHRHKRTYDKAERAVALIRQNKMTGFDFYCRGLVHFPLLLKEFLDIQREAAALISLDDLGSMFCRCIEHQPGDTFAQESIQYLIEFKGDLKLEIKLLPGKYNIDHVLYAVAEAHGVHDTYYSVTLNMTTNEIASSQVRDQGDVHTINPVALSAPYTYVHPDLVTKERTGVYTGFRDAYHILLYGGVEHLQSLIVRWDLWGDDCTADAAREFFNLSHDCPIRAVQAHVNRKCQL